MEEPFDDFSQDDESSSTPLLAVERSTHHARRIVQSGGQFDTVDRVVTLPLIDSHCHLGGKSLAGGLTLRFRVPLAKRGIGSFLQYNSSKDSDLCKKLMHSMGTFCGETGRRPHVACCAMVLDMGYVALKPVIATHASRMGAPAKHKETTIAKSEPLYYTHQDDEDDSDYACIWYRRDDKSWRQALDTIADACKKYPGRIWPFVGFDPRRPTGGAHVKMRIKAGKFVGVKLYSRTGWMPIHNRKMYGDDLGDELDDRLHDLYTYAVSADIPLLVHCSPTGFPPDDWYVPPWPFTNKRISKGFTATTKVTGPNGYGQVEETLWPPTYSDAWLSTDKGIKGDPSRAIQYCASELAHMCVYMQMTTSPYAWEPVLDKHKDLRLCLAHFGADLGAYSTKERDVCHFEAWQEGLELHPYTAGAPRADRKDYERTFRRMFEAGVVRLMKSSGDVSKSTRKEATSLIDDGFFEEAANWEQWFTAWEARYQYSWQEKILLMLASKDYPNLYTDIAFLTTNAKMFVEAFTPLVEEALYDTTAESEALKEKLMIGTDWFMIEMDSCSPRDFWTMPWQVVFEHKKKGRTKSERFARRKPEKMAKRRQFDVSRDREILWDLWSTRNVLRWLNLGPNGSIERLEEFYDCPKRALPAWWGKLKRYYKNGDHLLVPPYENSD